MKKQLSIFTFVILYIALKAQITIPLYEKEIPHNKPGIDVQEVISTGPNRFIRKISKPELYVYLPKEVKNIGKAVLILPGGGYGGLAIDHEGHHVAQQLNKQGIAGIVLKYRCPDTTIVNNKTTVPLQDAMRAMQLVRSNAKKWKIKKLGIMGASAGGHLASTVITHYDMNVLDNTENINLRPDFGILNYPVISFADSITHKGSRNNLIRIKGHFDENLVKLYSNELHVNTNTPPIYIIHAQDDDVVPVANSLLFIAACQQHNVPVQSFFYARGGHGFGMINRTATKQWIDDCIEWIKKL